MPLKIKHKQLHTVETIPYLKWVSYNQDLWGILRQWDVVKLYNVQIPERRYQSTLDLEEALNIITNNPNAFEYERINDFTSDQELSELRENSMSLIKEINEKVIQETKKSVKKHTYTRSVVSRLSNNKLVLYTRQYAKPTLIKTWKIIVAIFVFLSTCYLSSGTHFDDLINWLKKHF